MGLYWEVYKFAGKIYGIFAILATVSVVFALSLHFGHTNSFPLPPNSDAHVGYQQGANRRGTLDLIWSCLSTIFICVYVAMHVDIPNGRDGRWNKLLHKVGWMVIGLFAPEFVLALAASEFEIAMRVKRVLNGEDREVGWSRSPRLQSHRRSQHSHRCNLTFSYFVAMKGFCDRHGTPIGPWDLTDLWKKNLLQDLDHNLEGIMREIDDKSKADPLVKTVSCIQITWFLVNIIARHVTHMPISQLELTTCGYIVCTLATYVIWWYKPYDISEPIMFAWVDISMGPRQSPPTYDWIWNHFQYVAAASGTALFGMFHVFAWNSQFINTSGQLLWRICSIVVITAPIGLVFLGAFFESLPEKLNNTIGTCLGMIYTCARLLLVALLVLSFWSLPDAVYQETNWSSVIPSIS